MLAAGGGIWTGETAFAATPVRPRPGIRFEPLDPRATLTVDGVGTYRGAVEVTAAGGDGLTTIDDVSFQDYLDGLREVPASWPAAALEAQAIAARTYALWEVLAGGDSPWRAAGAHICATDSCQVYRGVVGGDDEDRPRWTAAVASTDRQVLLWNGNVILAMYSDSNGGRSVDGGAPWLPSVDDPDDAVSPLHHWHWSANPSALAPALGVTAPETLVALSGNGATAALLTLRRADGSTRTQEVSAGEFRSALNGKLAAPDGLPLPLPSDRYTVTTQGSAVVFDGGGWGHGVGMSQSGALGKAQRGLSAGDILASYYGGVRPVVVSPRQMPARIRVAVALGSPSVAVSSTSPVRVLGEDGQVVALQPAGQWSVSPGSGDRLRFSGPAGVDPSLVSPGLNAPPPPTAAGRDADPPVRAVAPARHRARGHRSTRRPRPLLAALAAVVLAGDTAALAARVRARP